MKITENKALRHTKNPCGWYRGMDKLETDMSKMKLVSVKRENENKLRLSLKTEDLDCVAFIEAIEAIGIKDLDLIEEELKKNFIGRSYKEILNTDFKPKASRIPWSET